MTQSRRSAVLLQAEYDVEDAPVIPTQKLALVEGVALANVAADNAPNPLNATVVIFAAKTALFVPSLAGRLCMTAGQGVAPATGTTQPTVQPESVPEVKTN